MANVLKSVGIVGGSLAGLEAAKTLRSSGFEGRVVMIGGELHAPYDRPPLSKQVLLGKFSESDYQLDFDHEALDVELLLGRRAEELDVPTRTVSLEGGEKVKCDGLVIATGARARVLDRPRLTGVHSLRTIDDARSLAAELDSEPANVVVIGGGFIGTEVASACRSRGLNVTIVESLQQPMAQALGVEVGGLIATMHRENGVELRLGVSVADIGGSDRVEDVRLSDGSVLSADLVVVAIGAQPETQWLTSSGLSLNDGVLSDQFCLVAPKIVAAGDVARWWSVRLGRWIRVEHWDNAIRQGRHAALTLLASSQSLTPNTYDSAPWVWSDQFGIKLQIIGSPTPYDEVRIVQGDVHQAFALYRSGTELAGAFAIGFGKRMLELRRNFEDGVTWSDALALVA
jgi:3-phenylpropionate/trans-cinnamate dioxygenase ferredoxin reductase subunit